MKKMKMYLMVAILGVASLSVGLTSCTTDKCADVVCLNGGLCDTEGDCECSVYYSGANCEIPYFVGPNSNSSIYSFSDQGGTACGNYTGNMTVTRSSVDSNKLIITNLGGFGTSTTVNATTNGSQLTIASQAIWGATGNTISGSGTFTDGVISGSYTNNDGVTTCTYSFTWTKQ